jgi:hypothetical protein
LLDQARNRFGQEIEDLAIDMSWSATVLPILVKDLIDTRVSEMEGPREDQGWSFANWADNVKPLPKPLFPEVTKFSIPYFTYHALDTYSLAVRNEGEALSQLKRNPKLKKQIPGIRTWLEDLFLQPGDHGDITKEPLRLGKLGFNVSNSPLTLFDNAYTIGSSLAASQVLAAIAAADQNDGTKAATRDRIRAALHYLATQALSQKEYCYSDADRSFPEWVFRLGGSRWVPRKDAREQKIEGVVHTKVYQDRALYQIILKALARYFHLFPERDPDLEGDLLNIGSEVMSLKRAGDARAPSLWEKHKYSFYYTNRVVGAFAEIADLIERVPAFRDLPAFRTPGQDLEAAVPTDMRSYVVFTVRSQVASILRGLADSVPAQENAGPLQRVEITERLKEEIAANVATQLQHAVQQMGVDEKIRDIIQQVLDESKKFDESFLNLQDKFRDLSERVKKLESPKAKRPDQLDVKI